jgi:ssDNA-specific exonuclease RecJ
MASQAKIPPREIFSGDIQLSLLKETHELKMILLNFFLQVFNDMGFNVP